MKTLIYAGGFAPVGGIESFVHAICTSLADREHSFTVLCWGKGSALLDDIGRRGVEIQRLPVQRGCRFRVPDLLLAAVYGAREVSRHDVVVFTKLPPGPLVSLLRSATGWRRRQQFIYITPYRPSEMWSDNPPSERILNSLDAIIVQAESFADDLRKLRYRGKIEVIPLVPPVISPAAAMPECGVIRIGFLGRLVPQKNVAHLLKAFALLDPITSSGFSRELHIYGDGCERAKLEQLTLSLDIGKRVHFHGTVRAEMVPTAIDRCHLFAFSSLSEGQCLAALEILSRGRPIVATPVGALPEILATRALGEISSLHDAQEFASALDRIGSEIATGRITPQAVQRDFGQIFARADVLRKYRAVLSAVEAVLPSHGHGSTALESKPVAEAKHERWSA